MGLGWRHSVVREIQMGEVHEPPEAIDIDNHVFREVQFDQIVHRRHVLNLTDPYGIMRGRVNETHGTIL